MAHVDRDGRHVTLHACEDYGAEPEQLDSAEAREVARRLVVVADVIDAGQTERAVNLPGWMDEPMFRPVTLAVTFVAGVGVGVWLTLNLFV